MPSITDDGEQAAGVHDAVEALKRASSTPAKQRIVKVSGVIDAICHHAVEEGLDADDLRAVARVVSRKTELDQTSVTNLIKNLYPSRRVPADVVVTMVGGLGQGKGKPSASTQNGLVKWLVIVHDIIEDPKLLSRLYGVLFAMLDMISIRTSLCHLLSLVTRRKHVKPFRIQQLLELSRGIGNEPALQGLLRIYKDYYPDIILSNASTSRKSFPPRPDVEWQKRLLAIQDTGSELTEPGRGERNGFRVLRIGHRRGLSLIPEVHTFHANESSVTLEEIDNVDDFVQKLERIEPPGQMISLLNDPLLQKLLDLRNLPILNKRTELWLSTCLEEIYIAARSGIEGYPYLTEILEGLYRHVQYTKEINSVVANFLREYVAVWDGVTAVDALLGILAYTALQPFQDAYDTYFSPVETALERTPSSYGKLLYLYTDLLRHWTNKAVQESSTPRSASRSASRKGLDDLVAHVSGICISIILSLPTDADSPLLSSILTFYESLSLSSQLETVPIVLPPPSLPYLLAQSASATVLSRVCGIYANYKDAFDKHPTPLVSFYSSDTLVAFNSCVRDLYNLLWGSKALQVVEHSPAFFCTPALREALNSYLARTEHEYAIGLAFGLSHNAWLASLSAAAWWSLEEDEIEQKGYDRDSITWHKGPVTIHTLEALEKNGGVSVTLLQYKKYVLHWLANRGCSGLKNLMYTTHAKLRK